MKEMIKKVKERCEGFTMAELLIVVAIIAVLVAIAIPVFTAQLEKSRESVDLANLRSAYAECSSSALIDTASGTGVAVNGTGDDKAYEKTVALQQKENDWLTENATAKIGNVTVPTFTTERSIKVSVNVKSGQATLTPIS